MNGLKEKILELGATNVGEVKVSQIPFDKNLRMSCEANSCGNYGKNHMCPPLCGSEDELIAEIKKYEDAIIFQTITPLEDSFDFEGMGEAAKNHHKLTYAVWEEAKKLYPDCKMIANGGCGYCEKCAGFEGEPCRFPDKALTSLSACCINVSSLAKKAGMKYINGANTVTYFSGIFLGKK